MSNNECSLIGWLEISDKQQTQDSEGKTIPVLLGYIHTDREYFGGKHPIVMKGRPADIVIEAAQHYSEPVQIFIVGKLRSRFQDKYGHVVVHYVRVLGAGGAGAGDLTIDNEPSQMLDFLDQGEQSTLEFRCNGGKVKPSSQHSGE